MLYARGDEDLRELLAAKLMDKIGFSHSDVILATDENGENGCLSVNILNENEEFVEPSKERIQYRAINIKELNARRENDFIFSTNEIHEISKETPLTLRDRVTVSLCKIKNKILGRDRDE